MSPFKVGEIAIGCGHVTLPDRNGMECEVLAPLQLVTAIECRIGTQTTKLRYMVRWADGLESYAQPHTLRKKLPPCERSSRARVAMLECIARAMRPAQEVFP